MSDINSLPPVGAPQQPAQSLGYDGAGGEIAKIALWNGFLTLITFGIFRFWAKTRMRRYVWSRFSFDGDRVEYTGTGGELFKGFLVASLLFLAFAFPLQIAIVFTGEETALAGVLNLVFLMVILALVWLAGFFAHRYRLTRTRWRGIRGGMQAKIGRYFGLVLGYGLLTIITLGITYPLGSLARKRFLWNNSRFGTAAITCDAKVGRAWLPWLLQYGIWIAFLVFSFFVIFGQLTADAMSGDIDWEDRDSLSTYFAGMGAAMVGWAIAYLFTIAVSTGCIVAYYLRELRQILNGLSVAGVKVISTLKARTMLWRIVALAAIQTVALLVVMVVFTVVAGVSVGVGSGGGPDPSGVIIGAGVLAYIGIAVLSVVLVALFWTNPLYRTIAQTTVLMGAIDMAAVGQNTDALPTRGEGLMELFAIDG
ncbi:YjgN family protein [Lacibacterium aquatile]|uniref:YjgN family protein n=1 Tax=Lacibacterium aquatile TaxID=1168082 RepID=A0ABW5DUJ2_9PROT